MGMKDGMGESRKGGEGNLSMLTEHIVAPPMMLALNMALVTSSTVLPSLRQKATPAADMTPPILLRLVRIWTRSNSPF